MSKIIRASNVTISNKKFHMNPFDNPENDDDVNENENDTSEAEDASNLKSISEEEFAAEVKKAVAEELEKAVAEESARLKSELANIDSLREEVIAQAKKEAEKIVSDANAKSSDILKKAEKDGKSLKDKILEEGRKEGYNAGMAKGKAEGDKLTTEGKKIVDAAKAERQKLLGNLEPEIFNVIIGVTTKLLRDAVTFNKGAIIHLIRAGLSDSAPSEEIKIKVSSDDYEAVVENKDEILKFIDGGTKLEIIRDLSLNKSDCIIETSYGYIDSSLGQQFEKLKENLYYIAKHGDME